MKHESAALMVAQLMCASAQTAPKSKGIDTIQTAIISGDQIGQVADMMDHCQSSGGCRFWRGTR